MVRLVPRTHLESPVDGSFGRQADRQPILESDQQSQAELKLSSHLVTVVDGGSISLLSYSLPNRELLPATEGLTAVELQNIPLCAERDAA